MPGLKRVDMGGKKFNRLTIIEFSHYSVAKSPKAHWKCICDCGKEIVVDINSVKYGNTKSCGCLNIEKYSTLRVTHGHTLNGIKSPEVCCYNNMIQRCYNPKNCNYPRYGARGITVCKRWRDSFQNFLSDIGLRPSRFHSMERNNNNGNYTPNNCRWATKKEQSDNRRGAIWLVFNEEKMVLQTFLDKIKCKSRTEVKKYLKTQTPEQIAEMYSKKRNK